MTLLEFVQNRYPYPADLLTVDLMVHIVNGVLILFCVQLAATFSDSNDLAATTTE